MGDVLLLPLNTPAYAETNRELRGLKRQDQGCHDEEIKRKLIKWEAFSDEPIGRKEKKYFKRRLTESEAENTYDKWFTVHD